MASRRNATNFMGFAERWKGSMSCTFRAEKCCNAPVFGTLIHRHVIVFVPEICTSEYILEIFKCLFLLCLGAYKGTDSSLFPMSLTPLSEGGQCCKGMHFFSWKTWNRAPPEFLKMPRWSTQWAFLTSPYITQIYGCCWMLLVTSPMVGFSSKGTAHALTVISGQWLDPLDPRDKRGIRPTSVQQKK